MSDRDAGGPGSAGGGGRTAAPSPMGGLPPAPRLRDFTKLPLVIVAAMFVLGGVLYPSLPATIPTHWGLSGGPDVFAPKSFGSVFLLPLVALGIYVLLVGAPYVDPRRRSLRMSIHAYNIVVDCVVALLALVFAASMFASFRLAFDVSRVVLFGIALLFVVIGSLLRSVRPNWTFGVRLPWTLSDNVVWQRTNRLAGYLFMAAGAAALVGAIFPAPVGMFVMLGVVAVVVVAVSVYSFVLFRRRHPEA